MIPPAPATFVAADFERQTLADALGASRFQFNAMTFFSWLGVTPYLTERAFDQTLEFVSGMPTGSGIVLDYAVPRESLNQVQQTALDALSNRVAAFGEPLRLFFEPEG